MRLAYTSLKLFYSWSDGSAFCWLEAGKNFFSKPASQQAKRVQNCSSPVTSVEFNLPFHSSSNTIPHVQAHPERAGLQMTPMQHMILYIPSVHLSMLFHRSPFEHHVVDDGLIVQNVTPRYRIIHCAEPARWRLLAKSAKRRSEKIWGEGTDWTIPLARLSTQTLMMACPHINLETSDFEDEDEFCPHCDNHFVLEAVTPEASLGVEGEDIRIDSR